VPISTKVTCFPLFLNPLHKSSKAGGGSYNILNNLIIFIKFRIFIYIYICIFLKVIILFYFVADNAKYYYRHFNKGY
jgi:hypothetical protein